MALAALLGVIILLPILVQYLRRLLKYRFIDDLRGPPALSKLLGHEIEMRNQDEVGDLDFQWIREYGTAYRIKGCYSEDMIMLADPKALQYIFHTSSYSFPKRADVIQSIKLMMGRGIVAATGDAHQRQRKIMNPAFSTAQMRSFLPIFRQSASRLSEKWKNELQTGDSSDKEVINVSRWLARTTLDVIGEASFDYRFGALENSENALTKSFDNLFVDSVMHPRAADLLFKAVWKFIPDNVLQLVQYIPSREYRRFRNFLNLAKKIAKDLVQEKASVTAKGDKDIMSVLVQANLSEDSKRHIDEDEMLSQMATLMLAGHETTASSLTWLLYELANHPEDQMLIREEINAARVKLRERGDEDFTNADLEAMVFTNAAIKEGMRLHPIAHQLTRTAARDDVIPLESPIETKSGQVITEIPISRGQNIVVSICGYNRLQSVWGEDAAEWNPTRFIESEKDTRKPLTVGVYANLMTFSGGIRGCIGWRFAVLEMQAILTELIETFEFAKPKQGLDIMRVPAGIMVPMIRGKMHEGVQMPLQVSVVPRD